MEQGRLHWRGLRSAAPLALLPAVPNTCPLTPALTHPPIHTCREALVEATEQTQVWATYVRGRLVDRVAADGSLAEVAQPMGDSQAGVLPLFQQFPLTCSVADKLYKGWDTKVVAFRVSGWWCIKCWRWECCRQDLGGPPTH